MNAYLAVKTLHILSSTILFGSGIAIAFFMLRSRYAQTMLEKHAVARQTVLADKVLTLPAVIIQPLSGAWLLWYLQYDWLDFWLVSSYILFLLIGVCWLPVVWIQIELEKMARTSLAEDTPLPPRYERLFKIWFWLGWPAFISIIAIFWLMVAKPQ